MSDDTKSKIALYTALAKAQGEIDNIQPNDEVKFGQTHFKFTNLSAIMKKVRPVLAKNGLSITFTTSGLGYHDRIVSVGKIVKNHETGESNKVGEVEHSSLTMKCTLRHISGEELVSEITSLWPLMGHKVIQEQAAVITMLRRYTLQMLLNITCFDDADADKSDEDAGKEIVHDRDSSVVEVKRRTPKKDSVVLLVGDDKKEARELCEKMAKVVTPAQKRELEAKHKGIIAKIWKSTPEAQRTYQQAVAEGEESMRQFDIKNGKEPITP